MIRAIHAPYRARPLVASQDAHQRRQCPRERLRGITDEQADTAPVEALDAPELESVALAAHQVRARGELGEFDPGLGLVDTAQFRVLQSGALGHEPMRTRPMPTLHTRSDHMV